MSTGVSDCDPHCSFLFAFEIETDKETFGASDRHRQRSGSAICDSYHEPTTISQQLFNSAFTSTTRGSLLSLIQTGKGNSERLGVWCHQELFKSPCCLIAGMCVHAMLWLTCRTSHSTRAEAAGSVKSMRFTVTHNPTKPQSPPKQSDQLKKQEPVGFHS